MEYKAPFPYFGGKSAIAELVWKAFDTVHSYVEPFFGSGAVLLARPDWQDKLETVNDADGLICNFWRALQSEPELVASHADWPVNENDLHARHAWLVGQKESLQSRLEGDPSFYDAQIAGWWVWGMSLWIGSGFCSGEGPWQVVQQNGSSQLVHLSSNGRGVNRQLVHLTNSGRGVNRQLVHLGDAGKPGLGEQGLLAWLEALSERLQRVRVCCGDWTRVCGGKSGDALGHLVQGGCCGIFLDPPYSSAANRKMGCYRLDDGEVAHAVREWAIAHGEDPRLRIILAGYEGEHPMPTNWQCQTWKTQGGMGNVSKWDNQSKENRERERLWFSPHCLSLDREKQRLLW